jgi:hypothetical protein
MEVGYSWIAYKLGKDFTSASGAQDAVSGAAPAVLGPGPALYLLDDHHTLAALDYSGYKDTKVVMEVICDQRNMTQEVFWQTMAKQHLVSHKS